MIDKNTTKAYLLVFAVLAIGCFFTTVKHASANASITFTAAQNGTLPATQNPVAQNTAPASGEAMNWTAAITYNQSPTGWLTTSPLSGTSLAAGGSTPLTVRPNTTNLAPGAHTAVIT